MWRTGTDILTFFQIYWQTVSVKGVKVPLCIVPVSQLLTSLCVGLWYYRAAPSCGCLWLFFQQLCIAWYVKKKKNQYSWIEMYQAQPQNNFLNVFFGGATTGSARINMRMVFWARWLGKHMYCGLVYCDRMRTANSDKDIVYITCLHKHTHTEGTQGFYYFPPLGLACHYPVQH